MTDVVSMADEAATNDGLQKKPKQIKVTPTAQSTTTLLHYPYRLPHRTTRPLLAANHLLSLIHKDSVKLLLTFSIDPLRANITCAELFLSMNAHCCLFTYRFNLGHLVPVSSWYHRLHPSVLHITMFSDPVDLFFIFIILSPPPALS